MSRHVAPRDLEITFDTKDIIVSKTDTVGRITYANRTFEQVCGYRRAELIGAPHSIVRHPDMPRAVFKLLWDTIARGDEVFAYVKNMAKCGGYYWVFAHVTPSYDQGGQIIGYHSTRRVPKAGAVAAIAPIYAALLAEEQRYPNAKSGLAASFKTMTDLLASKGIGYDEFVFSL